MKHVTIAGAFFALLLFAVWLDKPEPQTVEASTPRPITITIEQPFSKALKAGDLQPAATAEELQNAEAIQ